MSLQSSNTTVPTVEPNRTIHDYKECFYDLCTVSPEYYPSDHIKRALIASNLTDWPTNDLNGDAISVQNRFGYNQEVGSDNSERFCDINTFRLKPQLGKNIYNEERFIVNLDMKPQEIFVETCAGKSCNYIDLPISYRTECVQKFFHIPMLVYHRDEIRIDYIRFPSCCVCYVKQT